ncbi:hypothetical protein TNCV_629011 [Trichonephila clavipes]|nr:hypothetical protein TNCV_629011 [Trichonephila clavipes]
MTVYCRQWYSITSHQLWERCVAVNKGRIEVSTTWSTHTSTLVIISEIETGFIAKDVLVPFHCSPVSTLQAEASMGRRKRQHT